MVLYIYKFTNKITNKCYIGQTNNIEQRKRGHKSESFNKNAVGYNLPFHCAIRSYGWENFDFEILEQIEDSLGRDFLNEREIYYIKKFHSLVSENGYNLTKGGDGCSKEKLTFEEKCHLSKIFSQEEIEDIQKMLCEDYEFYEIKNKYPVLTASFLSNINTGLNFKKEDLVYPLKKYHTRFSKQTKLNIKKDIKSNIKYPDIAAKYNISITLLSMINNGQIWVDKNETYPLVKKIDYSWVNDCRREIIFSNKTLKEIAADFNISYSTIKLLVSGKHHYDSNFIYPLRANKNQNQKIYKELFNIVSTISGETESTAIIDTQSETV